MTKRILSTALALCVCLTMLESARVCLNNTGGGIAEQADRANCMNSE